MQDQTPGGRDESMVPEDKRLGTEVDVQERVKLLISNISLQLFNYVAQVGWGGPSFWHSFTWSVMHIVFAELHFYASQAEHIPSLLLQQLHIDHSTVLLLQGLFERHKLLVATQLCMRILKKKGEFSHEKFDILLRSPQVTGLCLEVVNFRVKVAGKGPTPAAGSLLFSKQACPGLIRPPALFAAPCP